MYIVFLDNAIALLIDNSIVQTKLLYALGKQEINVTCFNVIPALLWWSGMEPAISPRHACICNVILMEYTKKYIPFLSPKMDLIKLKRT